MRRVSKRFTVALLLIVAAGAPVAADTLTYTDGICAHRATYDAKSVDGRQLKATFDYLAGRESPIELPPPLETAEDIAAIDISNYRARCTAAHKRLADPVLIAQPGLDALRTRETDDLDTTCARTAAALAAATGDIAPARAYAPACTRYTDLLALPAATLKTQWNDLVTDLCRTSTERTVCAGALQRRGEGPGSEARRRIAVLTRWTECATVPARVKDGEKKKLLQEMARRFRAKAMSCAQ